MKILYSPKCQDLALLYSPTCQLILSAAYYGHSDDHEAYVCIGDNGEICWTVYRQNIVKYCRLPPTTSTLWKNTPWAYPEGILEREFPELIHNVIVLLIFFIYKKSSYTIQSDLAGGRARNRFTPVEAFLNKLEEGRSQAPLHFLATPWLQF